MHTIQRINYKTDNCYLIINDGKAVLFDTCSAEAYDTVLAECSKYDMQLIVLSHVHFESLIVGDALDNWIFPATGHLYSNKEELKKSAEKIKARRKSKRLVQERFITVTENRHIRSSNSQPTR